MTYHELLRRHGGTIAFGYGLALLSAFGQTFFISLFGPDIRDAFGLTNGSYGLIYSAATLASGMLMIWAGGMLDRVSTQAYAAAGLIGLGCAALGVSLAPGVLMLAVCLFGLRLCGQGMLSHAAVTSTAKLPHAVRGRAVGIATLGFSTAEALLPATAVALVGAVGWVWTWRIAGFVSLAVAAILVAGILLHRRGGAAAPAVHRGAGDDLRRRDVLTDWRFLIFIPSMIAQSAIGTGYFFHQRLIAEQQGWPVAILALSVSGYAVAAICSTTLTGYLTDRLGATRLCRFHLLPLACASLMLMAGGRALEAPVFFALLGVSAAANGVIVPAVLAELFGTERLGTVRALATAFMVAGSAATPGLFGFLFDVGVTPMAVGLACALYTMGSLVLNIPLRREGARARLMPAIAE